MSARIARGAFTAAARRSVLKPSLSSSRLPCRKLSTYYGPELPSDKPWIIGSLLVFGPALLYLLSPSAKKSHHAEHSTHSHDDHSKDKAPVPELMKDDEGGVADVASSVTLAESSDVPNDAQPAEKETEFKAVAEDDASKDFAATPPTTEGGEKSETADKETSKEADKKLPKAPTDMGEARKSAVEHVTPKEGAERKN